eukprot:gene15043-biopygen2136
MTFSRGCAGRQRTHADLGVTLKKDVIACMPVKSVGFGFGPGFARFRGGSPSTSLEDQEGGAGVARAWRGRGVGNRHLLAWGGADMARALPVPLGSVLHPLYCEWEVQWQTVASAAIATNHYRVVFPSISPLYAPHLRQGSGHGGCGGALPQGLHRFLFYSCCPQQGRDLASRAPDAPKEGRSFGAMPVPDIGAAAGMTVGEGNRPRPRQPRWRPRTSGHLRHRSRVN